VVSYQIWLIAESNLIPAGAALFVMLLDVARS